MARAVFRVLATHSPQPVSSASLPRGCGPAWQDHHLWEGGKGTSLYEPTAGQAHTTSSSLSWHLPDRETEALTGLTVVLGCLPVHPGTLAFPGLVCSGNGASGPSWPLVGEQGSHGSGMDVNADPLQGDSARAACGHRTAEKSPSEGTDPSVLILSMAPRGLPDQAWWRSFPASPGWAGSTHHSGSLFAPSLPSPCAPSEGSLSLGASGPPPRVLGLLVALLQVCALCPGLFPSAPMLLSAHIFLFDSVLSVVRGHGWLLK